LNPKTVKHTKKNKKMYEIDGVISGMGLVEKPKIAKRKIIELPIRSLILFSMMYALSKLLMFIIFILISF
jgi:hypothetical protein